MHCILYASKDFAATFQYAVELEAFASAPAACCHMHCHAGQGEG